MTITQEHRDRAKAAVNSAMFGVGAYDAKVIQDWISKNTSHVSLVDMLAWSIALGWQPTVRPSHESAKAYREATLVADGFDAACTFVWGPGRGPRAFRGNTQRFRTASAAEMDRGAYHLSEIMGCYREYRDMPCTSLLTRLTEALAKASKELPE